MSNDILAKVIGTISRSVMAILILTLTLANLTPFGASAHLSSADPREVSNLGPGDRVSYTIDGGSRVAKQINNLAYFSTPMPFSFEHATVKITYENPYPDQDISLGFQDQSSYHYQTELFDSSLMDALNWSVSGSGTYIYQRSKKYNSVDQLINEIPKTESVGIYGIKLSQFSDPNLTLDHYTPSSKLTVFDTPMRGSQSMFVYLENEPFSMRIEKQDLNWYKGPDTLIARIYKGDNLVYEQSLEDDGINDDSRKLGPTQELIISNPGPSLPASGVYRIELEAPYDVIIKKITTNLHKVIWQGPVSLISNAESYKGVIDKTTPNIIYTSSKDLTLMTPHPNALQTALVGDSQVNIDAVNKSYRVDNPGNVKISLPKSDIILDGSGFFAFNRDQFFWPSSINTLEIAEPSDFSLVNYVLSSFKANPTESDGSRTSSIDFDLSTAYVKNRRLSWVISAPGLKEKKRQITIKNIEVTMYKQGWFK